MERMRRPEGQQLKYFPCNRSKLQIAERSLLHVQIGRNTHQSEAPCSRGIASETGGEGLIPAKGFGLE